MTDHDGTPAQDQPDRGSPKVKEWDKLTPAISKTRADSLLSARRQERGIPVTQAPAPWTAPIPQVTNQPQRDELSKGSSASPQLPGNSGQNQQTQESEETAALAAARQEAVEDRPRLLWARRIIMAISVPIVIIMCAIRLVASPLFLWAEYHRPGFPADSYGFNTEERMRLGSYGLDYILNLAPASYLGEITTDNKTAFLISEVEHMTDVKHVILAASIFTLVMVILALLSARSLGLRAPGVIRASVFSGAWLTILLCIGLAAAGILGWETFFNTFHHIFFPQGNWQFRMSDTLIRLYPPQFWIDAAATAGVLILGLSLALLTLTWPTRYRKQQALKRRAERQELKQKLSS